MTPTTILRPVHAWFFAWENLDPPIYRVLAVTVAAAISTVLLAAVGVHPALAGAIALPAWIGLALAQEHDERVMRPPDQRFVAALTAAMGQDPLRLCLDCASGPSRARRDRADRFSLSTDGANHHPHFRKLIMIERNAEGHEMWIDVFDDALTGEYETLETRLRARGLGDLANRVRRAEDPEADADALAAALRIAYW